MSKIKTAVCGIAAVAMIVSGAVSAGAAVNTINNIQLDTSLFTAENKDIEIADYYTSSSSNTLFTKREDGGAGWTTTATNVTFDNDTYKFLGFTGDVTMADGYGAGDDWVAIRFTMVGNSGGDYAVYDISGNAIYGDCYAATNKKTDYYWAGHGERSYDGGLEDDYKIKRFSNYLKTEVTSTSQDANTVKMSYGDNANNIVCTKLIENKYGTLTALANNAATTYPSGFSGDYYTVKTYSNDTLIGIDYYSGHFNGVKTIKDKGKNYYGNITIYSGKYPAAEEPEAPTAAISAADWSAEDETGYTVDETNKNKLTALDGTVVYGYKATFDNISSDTTYTTVKATVKKSGGSDDDVRTQEKSIPNVNTDGSVVFYILSTEALDLENSSIVLE